MGKVLPKGDDSRTSKRKKRLRRSGNKYLKPGALVQLRYSKASAAKPCTDLGKKRVAVIDTQKTENDIAVEHKASQSSLMLSPVDIVKQSNLVRTTKIHDMEIENKAFNKSPLMLSPVDIVMQSTLVRTPKTPQADPCNSESRLESLPMDLLVKLLCHLHHDQLKAVFHVSQRIRRAVLLAKHYYFNYTTPDRSRQEIKADGNPAFVPRLHTPKAPRHGPRPPSRIKIAEMKQIAAVLFQDQTFSSRCMVPSVIQKPLCKSLASNRVLFYEDELCQAVAQNKLR
ncbi:PREDICTED: F-box protein At4g35930 isoform X2 [Tarenaya hassleriana]|uniref:F-box protein At4g35930 isoform X2 n=1 Tax=Tarenaya hassleriana TaxID=28532 RepID=UPI00053C08AA|nr:PREDICTED: F-box protein At4g35930 isoform X2 [Tarenaya hassleriana]